MTPASQAFNAIQLKSQAEFTIQQNITVSNSAPVGFVTIPNMVTTASNRVTNNSFVVEVLDNCRTDGAFANNRVDINQKVGYAWCTMLGYAWDSTNTTIINPSPADCNLKFRLERYGILVDCTIDRDSIIVNSVSPLNVGPIKGGANIQNLTFTGSGNGKITFNHGKIQSATINLECDMVIYNNIPTCSIGTRTVRDYQHFYFPF